jgi:hypothetical protein
MAEFRKAGYRTFYRINGLDVLKVINMEYRSMIDVSSNNPVILCDARDAEKEITESEFNEQLELANQRIKEQRI